MPEAAWFEVHAVVRCDPEVLDKARAWLKDSAMAEANRFDVVTLDNQLRRWDGGRPPGVVVVEPDQAVFDDLRRGLHLHEQ